MIPSDLPPAVSRDEPDLSTEEVLKVLRQGRGPDERTPGNGTKVQEGGPPPTVEDVKRALRGVQEAAQETIEGCKSTAKSGKFRTGLRKKAD